MIPAGVFYYNISDPIVSATTESAEEIEDKIKGELRLKGMVNSDKDIAEKMDNTGGHHLIFRLAERLTVDLTHEEVR